MPVTITYGKAASSNENQTLPKNPPDSTTKPPEASQPFKGHPAPFIDRISIVLTVPTGETAYDIHSNIWSQFADKETFKEGAKTGKFPIGKRLMLPSVLNAKKWPLLQYRYESGKAVKFRIEFSPIDLGLQGLDELQAILISIVPDGWPYFVQHGRITMIEITVDLPNVQMSDFHLLPQQVKTASTWKANGQLETLMLGKSKSNQTKAYNRGQKRIDKKQGWEGPPTTRIERRLKLDPTRPLWELGALTNPFAAMQLVVPQTAKPPGENKGYVWEMFLDSVTVRGLPTALKLLPDDKRTVYRKWFAAYPQPWWNPDAIWTKWPGAYMPLLKLGG